MELLEKTNVGRDINRHYYTKAEISAHINKPFHQKFKELMLLRNNHPAFNGEFNLAETAENILNIKWINKGDWAELFIDLEKMQAEIKFSEYNGKTNLTVH